MSKTATAWTTAIAAAALVALPMIATAQTYPPAGQTTSGQSQSQVTSPDQNTPQFHLDEAKRVLDSVSTSDLTGAAISEVSKIKTQFTDLYNDYKNKSGVSSSTTGQVGTSGTPAIDWKTQFNKIEGELDGLSIPKSSYAPSTGVSGTTGMSSGAMANVTLSSEVKDSLTQFRTHLEQFYSLAQPQR